MRNLSWIIWTGIIIVLTILVYWVSDIAPQRHFLIGEYEVRISVAGVSIICLLLLIFSYNTCLFLYKAWKKPVNLLNFIEKTRLYKLIDLEVDLIAGLIVSNHTHNSKTASKIKRLLYDNQKLFEMCSLLAKKEYGATDGVMLSELKNARSKEVYGTLSLQTVTEGGELIVMRDKVDKMWPDTTPPQSVVLELIRAMIRSEAWDELDRYVIEQESYLSREQYYHLKALGIFNICCYLSSIGLLEDVFLLMQEMMLLAPEMIYAPLMLIDIIARYGDRRNSMGALRTYLLRSSFRGLGSYMLRLFDSQTAQQMYDFTIAVRVHDTTDQEVKFVYILACLMLEKFEEADQMLHRCLEEDDRSIRICLLKIFRECHHTPSQDAIWMWVKEALMQYNEFLPTLYFNMETLSFTQTVPDSKATLITVRLP